jgi:2-polyprenyl-3-methyl-5-hydroxy-6-metoxy-1,4-benzoquinol methylase
MLSAQLYAEGMAYAETNFKDEHASHLQVDKQLIRENYPLDGKKVLDFGCGMGGMSLWYATQFSNSEVIGIDIDPNHITIANALKSKHAVSNVQFEVRNLLDQALDIKFDYIMLNDVAEHIQLPILQAIFVELSKCLAVGGSIFLSYPIWRGPHASHVDHVLGIPWCQYLPQGLLYSLIEKHNRQIVGAVESNLLQAYKGLNRLTYKRLNSAFAGSGLRPVFRKNHSFLNKYPPFKKVELWSFPLDFFVTKEFLLLQK